MHNLLSLPAFDGSRLAWPPFQQPDERISVGEIANIRQAGFDFVRLTVSPEMFLASSGRRVTDLLGIVRARVEQFRTGGLSVLVDLHPTYNVSAFAPDRIINRPDVFGRYVETVGRLAGTLGQLGEGVALELMNEPDISGAGARNRWRAMTVTMADAARAEASALPLMACGHDGAPYETLLEFDPLPASYGPVLYTYHYYLPGIFTHQTEIEAAEYISGLEWPPQPNQREANIATIRANLARDRALSAQRRAQLLEESTETLDYYYQNNHTRQTIAREFRQVADWADRHGVPREAVILGEFGVVRTHWRYVGAKEASRLAWLEAVRSEAEAMGFGWAVWTYRGWGGMAITDREDVLRFDGPTLRALGLNAQES
ncbi:MAG: glycoside hydrolase family 5 protein [Hyphomonadaceae bacterium]